LISLQRQRSDRNNQNSYALVATATDYDAWRPHVETVTAAEVFKTLKQNAETSRHVAANILEDLHAAALQGDILTEEVGSMKYSIMPRPDKYQEEDRVKLAYILPDYFKE
jgi:5'-methylthioadenosine phosphorylase